MWELAQCDLKATRPSGKKKSYDEINKKKTFHLNLCSSDLKLNYVGIVLTWSKRFDQPKNNSIIDKKNLRMKLKKKLGKKKPFNLIIYLI
jgi:hypothetical protein